MCIKALRLIVKSFGRRKRTMAEDGRCYVHVIWVMDGQCCGGRIAESMRVDGRAERELGAFFDDVGEGHFIEG